MLQMAKRPGRERRQDVQRDAEGRISRSEYRREDVRAPAAWNRLRDIAEEIGMDPRITSQLGKLFYNRDLTATQFAAGIRWAEEIDRYDWLKLCARRDPPPPSFEARSPGEPSSIVSPYDAAWIARHEETRKTLGVLHQPTSRLCRGEPVGAFLAIAIRGLDFLAEHWGLTGARKSRRHGGAK